MSNIRPTLCMSTLPAPPDETALYMIAESVTRRQGLVYGTLHNGKDSCAIGAFFRDNPKVALNLALIDEVATYNDSVPPRLSMRTRRNRVLKWLRWKLRNIAVART